MFIDTDITSTPPRPAAERNAQQQNRPVRGAADNAASSPSSYAKIAGQTGVNPSAETGALKAANKEAAAKSFSLWQNEDFSFGDLLDIINPLQHVPVVATLYRNWSGDQIGTLPRVIGGAVWGRLGGFIAGIVNSVVEWFTGKDIGAHIYSALWGESGANSEITVVAGAAKRQDPSVVPTGAAVPVVAELPPDGATSAPMESKAAPRQNPPPITREPQVTPLSSRAPALGGVISSHVYLSRYQRDDDRLEAPPHQSKLRLSA